jgi:hypothetical protein
MSAILCEHRVQARRPGNYLALGVGMAVCYLVATTSGNPLLSVLGASYLGLVLWRLVRNPQTGFRLRSDRIETMFQGRLRVVSVAQVESFRLSLPQFAPALCLLTLRSGEVLAVHCGGAAHARTLAAGLQQRGVPEA